MNEITSTGKSSLGLNENIAGLLCYVLGWITGLVFFLLEKDSTFVKFHAKQSMILFGGLFVLAIVLSFIPVLHILSLLLGLVQLALWIFLMVKAFQGEKFKLPVVGDMAEK
jgi:uncharacterized membrane protein